MSQAAYPQQGFTLIEVLVALTLLALVSLMSWRGLDAAQHVGERLDARAQDTLAMVRALGQIARDVRLRPGPGVLPDTDLAPADAAGPAHNGAAQPALPPGMDWSAQTGLGMVRAAGDGRWQRLHWYLRDGILYRSVAAPSYLWPLPDVEAPVAVLHGVRAFAVRLWLPGLGWADATAPANAAPATAARTTTAPSGSATGLEVSIYTQDGDARQPYRKVVVLR
ncbi:PulJ/GspJ family protein [Candidimonas nitroreducens]|uniref:General secretion pathway protein GspJ n=1 Tax=Candidimonas nitroreducens TaxID=683354 RepID=A0A225M3E0_9BURK|nr:prepilin-type N-terminal cleavage/methylation domain-containing protein [Candidimonas nitroreducens]OWT53469.1 general secretion pathway protein GspJ [Candidimonas nitroreducens]